VRPGDAPIDLAERTALHFVQLLFGFRAEAHSFLRRFMQGAYTALVFQIVGRHFVAESGLPPDGSPAAVELKERLDKEIDEEAELVRTDPRLIDLGLPTETVIGRLRAHYGRHSEELIIVVLGLIAGTIGNVRAAVWIAINDFFTQADGAAPLIDRARAAARGPGKALEALIGETFLRNPPAAFLARTAIGEHRSFKGPNGDTVTIRTKRSCSAARTGRGSSTAASASTSRGR
jgi:hypothetical protein